MYGKTLRSGALAFLAAALFGCGAGGNEAAPQTDFDHPVETGGGVRALGQVVVQYDRNGDDEPDLVTLDRTDAGLRIAAVLDGSASGAPVDRTHELRGTTIDPALASALDAYLADSIGVATEMRLELTDSAGNTVPVTLYE